jgi:hypothetical protein
MSVVVIGGAWSIDDFFLSDSVVDRVGPGPRGSLPMAPTRAMTPMSGPQLWSGGVQDVHPRRRRVKPRCWGFVYVK